MRTWGIIFVIMATVVASFGSTKELSIEQMKARLPNAKPDELASLSVQIAEHQVENADKLYAGGKSEEAAAAIHEVVEYSEKAREAAEKTGHRLKNIEIAVRRMTHRLNDIKRSLPFDDQAAVQEAMEHLEKIDTDLLNRMFGKNPK